MVSERGRMAASVVLINPKSAENVGAVMRAAGCFRLDSVFYSGTRYARAARFATDTRKVNKDIPLIPVSASLDGVPQGMAMVCVELVEGATPLPDFQHPGDALYVFGPEDGSIGQQLIDRADAVVYVPTVGCLNLAASVNVVLYDRLAKAGLDVAGDELIRRSRDTNNRLRTGAALRRS